MCGSKEATNGAKGKQPKQVATTILSSNRATFVHPPSPNPYTSTAAGQWHHMGAWYCAGGGGWGGACSLVCGAQRRNIAALLRSFSSAFRSPHIFPLSQALTHASHTPSARNTGKKSRKSKSNRNRSSFFRGLLLFPTAHFHQRSTCQQQIGISSASFSPSKLASSEPWRKTGTTMTRYVR